MQPRTTSDSTPPSADIRYDEFVQRQHGFYDDRAFAPDPFLRDGTGQPGSPGQAYTVFEGDLSSEQSVTEDGHLRTAGLVELPPKSDHASKPPTTSSLDLNDFPNGQ